jgi:hypothetical protein
MKNMKIKSLIAAMLPLVFGLLALQSCNKEDGTTTVFHAFTTPTVTAPANAATVKITGTTVDLKWVSTNADGASPLADVYFGLDAKPAIYKAGNAGTSITVPVVLGKTYYWKVTMKDANGVMTYGPTWSFTVYDPTNAFVGTYNVDEPAEGWSYIITTFNGGNSNLTVGTGKASVTPGAGDGWWASWVATFKMDFVANTYTMAKTNFGGGYEGQESGTINPATGQMIGNYTVWQNGAVAETGKHTYTKK